MKRGASGLSGEEGEMLLNVDNKERNDIRREKRKKMVAKICLGA